MDGKFERFGRVCDKFEGRRSIEWARGSVVEFNVEVQTWRPRRL
jgi:hypothetical protein